MLKDGVKRPSPGPGEGSGGPSGSPRESEGGGQPCEAGRPKAQKQVPSGKATVSLPREQPLPEGMRSVDPMPEPRDASCSSWEAPIDVDGGEDKEMGSGDRPEPSCPTRTVLGVQSGGGFQGRPGALLRGELGPGPQQGLGPSIWQHWPDVRPGAPVNNECPRERAVEALIRSDQGQRWLREISDGLWLNSSLRDLLRRRIRFLFIQGGRVARDLGMVGVDERLITALDSLRGDVWSCVLRDSTSPVTLLLSLDPSVVDRGLGLVGNIPIPEFLWDFLAPVDFQDVTSRDLGEMREISHEGLIMPRALVRDGVPRPCTGGGGGGLRHHGPCSDFCGDWSANLPLILSVSRMLSSSPRVNWGVHRGRGSSVPDDTSFC